jgi:hypothetical protein
VTFRRTLLVFYRVFLCNPEIKNERHNVTTDDSGPRYRDCAQQRGRRADYSAASSAWNASGSTAAGAEVSASLRPRSGATPRHG